ncbi:MAG TPA: UDP-N-acetylglucosamine 2-epimerase (non-hydrolyzing) [Casimicrobiaceae bacterium]|nr:UDP-N-acetylglucosamine 2-epimerase (non-hydrolyzing) [Casimicrobiaceae bacterium]
MMGEILRPGGPIVCVVGARPNYMKMAPLIRAFGMQAGLPGVVLVHTGQHYDIAMNERLFADLEMPAPDLNLEVGSGTHAVQTAEVMRRFEPVVDDLKPSCVIVVGDVNSTLACSLVAVKKRTPVVHVEAGLRSFDRDMPEEINRILTDQIADLLYTTEREAADNLAREGVDAARVAFVGNVMIDSMLQNHARAIAPAETLARVGIDATRIIGPAGYGVVTLHRPSNVDSPDALVEALAVLRDVAARVPLVWPMHPRARANIERFGFASLVADARIAVLEPQGYLEMLGLLANARLVLTDSGGIQEETTALAVPCLTMRENTERPITVAQGTNTLVGRDRAKVAACVEEILAGGGKQGRVPELWDGRAAVRIAAHLQSWLATRQAAAEQRTA